MKRWGGGGDGWFGIAEDLAMALEAGYHYDISHLLICQKKCIQFLK